MKIVLFLYALLLSFVFYGLCSQGDYSLPFKKCMTQCKRFFSVEKLSEEYSFYYPNLFIFRLFFWNIKDECKYQCMHLCEFVRPTAPRPFQYFGKWPFYRILGIQEFFSVLFSLMNLYAHKHGYERARKVLYPSPMYKYYFLTSCGTWISSAIFHTRDTPFTEFFDYAFAFASLLFALFIAIDRVFIKGKSYFLRQWIATAIILFWAVHYYKMVTISFDYSWNMTLSIIVAMMHSCIWLYWAYLHPMSYYPFKIKIIAFCSLLTMASLLEMYDFPPFFKLIDAHSLWHAFTSFLVPLYWSFLKDEYSVESLILSKM